MNRAPADWAIDRPGPDPGGLEPAGLAGDLHPGHLVAHDVHVAQHERGDLHQHRRHMQGLETGQQIARRSRGGEDDRGQHPDGALGHDAPGRPQPGFGQLQTEDLDLRVRAGERHQGREQQERHLDDHPGQDHPRRQRRDRGQADKQSRVQHERPHRADRGGHHDEHEHHQGQDLDLGRQQVDRGVAVDVQLLADVVAVPVLDRRGDRHQPPTVVSTVSCRRRRASQVNRPNAIAATSATPTTPASPPDSRPSSTPDTA